MQNTTATTTGEAPLAIYRSSYPDITQHEAEILYPLFLQATEPGQTPEQWQRSFAAYHAALAPIRERNRQRGGRRW